MLVIRFNIIEVEYIHAKVNIMKNKGVSPSADIWFLNSKLFVIRIIAFPKLLRLLNFIIYNLKDFKIDVIDNCWISSCKIDNWMYA